MGAFDLEKRRTQSTLVFCSPLTTCHITFQKDSETILDLIVRCKVKAGKSIPACWRQNSLWCDGRMRRSRESDMA